MARGERHETDVLVRRFARDHGKQLVRLAARLAGPRNAEDVAQDAFVSLAKLIDERPHDEVIALLHEPVALRKLMCTITARRAYDHLRQQRRMPPMGSEGSAGSSNGEIPLIPELRDEIQCVERAYQSLSPVQRIAHVLHCYYGFTDTELADTLAISKTNSRTLVCRATRALRRAMENMQ
jgi:RNA polymerase sigma factor (sigma-70 family)